MDVREIVAHLERYRDATGASHMSGLEALEVVRPRDYFVAKQ